MDRLRYIQPVLSGQTSAERVARARRRTTEGTVSGSEISVHNPARIRPANGTPSAATAKACATMCPMAGPCGLALFRWIPAGRKVADVHMGSAIWLQVRMRSLETYVGASRQTSRPLAAMRNNCGVREECERPRRNGSLPHAD